MIVMNNKRWFGSLFAVRGTGIERIWLRLLVTLLVTVAVTLAWYNGYFRDFTLSVAPFSLVGLALSIFLGFRNGASYDRYWEGRKLWGGLVNNSRTFARGVLTLSHPATPEDAPAVAATQRALVLRQVAFVHALRMHLRREVDLDELRDWLPAEERAALSREINVPAAINHETGAHVAALFRAGHLHPQHLLPLDLALTVNTDVQGACERILSTPVPWIYTVLMHRLVGIYCLFLPFGLVKDIGWATPVVVLIVAYAFYGLDGIGEEVEEPFGTDPNDLPISALSRMIEVNLLQRLGDTTLPPLHKPVAEVLK